MGYTLRPQEYANMFAASAILLKACEAAVDDLCDTVNYDEKDPRTLATVAQLNEAINAAKGN